MLYYKQWLIHLLITEHFRCQKERAISRIAKRTHGSKDAIVVVLEKNDGDVDQAGEDKPVIPGQT